MMSGHIRPLCALDLYGAAQDCERLRAGIRREFCAPTLSCQNFTPDPSMRLLVKSLDSGDISCAGDNDPSGIAT